MEESIISTTKEGENEPQLNKGHSRVFQHPQHCSSTRPAGPDHQHKVLLQISAAFEGEHLAKVTRSVMRKELDSSLHRHRALLVH
jgi:hypothetical protein